MPSSGESADSAADAFSRRYAAVVAACENDVIGRDGALPWRLPADLRRFRRITIGHHLVMGRRTFQSIGRILPGRTTVILTRDRRFEVPGAVVVHDVAAVDRITAGDSLPMVVGGAETYRLFWRRLRELFFTRVHTHSSGDTRLEWQDSADWELLASEREPADQQNEFATTFQHWRHRKAVP